MQPREALEILEDLSRRLRVENSDPALLQPLLKSEQLRTALHCALEVLRSAAVALETASAGKANAGKRWSDLQDQELAQLYDQGTPLAELAQRLGRSRQAVHSRLVRLAKIDPDIDFDPGE